MSKEDSILIGIINFDDILNEDSIGKNFNVKRYGPCEIIVYTTEGNIPHFHIVSNDNKFKCCVRIYENRYFSHGDNKGKLNSKECKELDKWLRQQHDTSKYGIMTNWNKIESIWRNAHNNIPPTLDQPDYRKILEG